MELGELVDVALAGFVQREAVTIPSLPDADQWTDFEAARKAMIPNFSQVHAAKRYLHRVVNRRATGSKAENLASGVAWLAPKSYIVCELADPPSALVR